MTVWHNQRTSRRKPCSPAAAFYIGGDPAFVSEGTGRAGGLLAISPLPTAQQFEQLGKLFGKVPQGAVINKGDVVWLAYTAETIGSVQATANDLEQKGCLVIAFGPRPAGWRAAFYHIGSTALRRGRAIPTWREWEIFFPSGPLPGKLRPIPHVLAILWDFFKVW